VPLARDLSLLCLGISPKELTLTAGPRTRVFDFNARRRDLDIQILWPICKQQANERGDERGGDIDHAKAAFALHAFNDQAWLVLGEEEIKRRIDALV